MSNALAIATVTGALQQVLQTALDASGAVAGATVTFLRPDASTGLPDPGINIFLYQVTPNAALRNADLPTRRAGGDLLRRPRVALDLHYLLTFYGADGDLVPQRLLGLTARELHANPAVTRKAIGAAKTAFAGALGGSDLDKEPDLVRVVPAAISLEELSKVWSVLFQTRYALSAAYLASVVLIETDDPVPGPALPVAERAVFAVPLAGPEVDAVGGAALAAAGEDDAVAAAGAAAVAAVDPPSVPFSDPLTLALVGRHLNAAGNAVVFSYDAGGSPPRRVELSGTIEPYSTDRRLIVTAPPGLRAGAVAVRVVTTAPLGSPASPPLLPVRPVSESNVAVFEVQPVIAAAVAGRTVTVTVSPPVGADQTVALLLNDAGGVGSGGASLSPVGPRPAGTAAAALTFDAAALPAGRYLARLVVDGAESPLARAAGGGPYAGPAVMLL